MRIGWILIAIVFVTIAAGGYAYWVQQQASRVAPGLARANGRIEIERVDVAAKYPGRLAEVRVSEGAPVKKGDILARIDTTEVTAH
jgi:HlyD family secretion protein